MSFFEIPSVPFDESTRTRTLKVVTGTLYNEIIIGIGEMRKGKHTNLYYLSKQTEVDEGLLITIYTESEIDPGSIYLLSLDEKLELVDYHKLGYERCDLEQQSDTCEISFCDIIVAQRIRALKYAVVSTKEREFDCDAGKRKEVETDSTQVTIENLRFMLKKLK